VAATPSASTGDRSVNVNHVETAVSANTMCSGTRVDNVVATASANTSSGEGPGYVNNVRPWHLRASAEEALSKCIECGGASICKHWRQEASVYNVEARNALFLSHLVE